MRNSRQAVNQANFNAELLARTKIKLPPIEVQKQLAAQLNEEMAVVKQNRRLMEIFEQKIKDRISEV